MLQNYNKSLIATITTYCDKVVIEKSGGELKAKCGAICVWWVFR